MPLVEVKLLAVLKGLTDKPELRIEFKEGSSLRDLVLRIAEASPAIFKRRFLNSKGDGLSPDIIVLIDNSEASIHGGMDAVLKDGSEIVFLPTVHGG